jgi:hypothetical protein
MLRNEAISGPGLAPPKGDPKTNERSEVLSRGLSARFQPQGSRGLRFARNEVSIASVSPTR